MARDLKCGWRLALVGLIAVIVAGKVLVTRAPVSPVTVERIGVGKYQTPAYVIAGAKPGPTLLVVGGVHGNEPAGHLAALRLVKKSWQLARGRLIIVPAGNRPALQLGLRAVPNEGDLNRSFSAEGKNSAVAQFACALLAAVEHWDVAAVVDLHEGYGCSARDEQTVGRSVIMYPNDASATLALAVVEALNAHAGAGQEFTFIGPPVQGSLAAALGAKGAAAIIVETSEQDPLEQRVKEHCLAVERAIAVLGLVS